MRKIRKLMTLVSIMLLAVGCTKQQLTVKDLKEVLINNIDDIEVLRPKLNRKIKIEDLLQENTELFLQYKTLKDKGVLIDEIYSEEVKQDLISTEKQLQEKTINNILSNYTIQGFKIKGNSVEIQGKIYADTRMSKAIQNTDKISEILNQEIDKSLPYKDQITDEIQKYKQINDLMLQDFNDNTEKKTHEEIEKDLENLKRVVRVKNGIEIVNYEEQNITNVVEPTPLKIYYKITDENKIEFDKEKTIESIKTII